MNRISPFIFLAYQKLLNQNKNKNHPQYNTHKKTHNIPPPLPHKHCCRQKRSKKKQGIGHISRGGCFFCSLILALPGGQFTQQPTSSNCFQVLNIY